MFNLEEKLPLLKAYFAKQPEIIMAFVFGSAVRGQETQESDVDIAVYFKPVGRSLEWEEQYEYVREDEIWGEVEKIVGKRTDLVILNRAPSTLAYSVLQDGKVIVVKDLGLYWRFFLLISSAAEDFREFVKDFWTIKQRSFSLSEIDKNRLIKIIDFMESELVYYSNFTNLDQGGYERDVATRRNLERWAENIVNASIDLAKIILSSEKKEIPQTYREILQKLGLLNGFDGEVAERLSRFAKLRNVLAHEYLDLRFAQLKKFVNESESDYKKLIAFSKELVSK